MTHKFIVQDWLDGRWVPFWWTNFDENKAIEIQERCEYEFGWVCRIVRN